MEDSYREYSTSIVKVYRFGFSLKYQEEFRVGLERKFFTPLAIKEVEKLGWDIVYFDTEVLEINVLRSVLGSTSLREVITISYSTGEITVKSESVGDQLWDNGQNSVNVRLFIHVFKEAVSQMSNKELEQLFTEHERINNWDDYIIPDTLPKPTTKGTANPILFFLCVFGLSLLIAYVLAKLSVSGMYYFGVYELIVTFVITFAVKHLVQFTNYTEFSKLQNTLIGAILFIFLLKEYIEYELFIIENSMFVLTFADFIQERIKRGLVLDSFELGWIGFVVSRGLQIAFVYFLTMMKFEMDMVRFYIERIPGEVINFAYYHLVKHKTKDEVNIELAKKGWDTKQQQAEVFEAVDAVLAANQIRRGK